MLFQAYTLLAAAGDTAKTFCLGDSSRESCDTNLPTVAAGNGALADILTIVFAIIGVVAVLMVLFGGFKFIEAQGDPQNVKKARNTILYAIIGLVIAISAEIIVAFVLKRL